MFSQHSINADTISCNSHTRVPIVTGLDGVRPSLSPVSGMVALDSGSERLHVGSSGSWKAVGDTIGPNAATQNTLVRFDGNSGKIIKGSCVTLSDHGDLCGVSSINGLPICSPSQQNNDAIKGPINAVTNQIAKFNNDTGKSVVSSTVQISDNGDLTNVASINGELVATGKNTGDVTLTAFGASPNDTGATFAGQILTLQPASVNCPGGVNTVNQSFAGTKDFSNGGIVVSPSVQGVDNVFRGYYKTPQAGVQVTWDPNTILFDEPIQSSIRCERIGDMIFLKLSEMIAQPQSADRLESNIGAIPPQFRPSEVRGCSITAVNGSADYTLPYNVTPGYALIYPNGQIAFGMGNNNSTSATSGVLNDGITLTPFSGPNKCGIFGQVLMYEA